MLKSQMEVSNRKQQQPQPGYVCVVYGIEVILQ